MNLLPDAQHWFVMLFCQHAHNKISAVVLSYRGTIARRFILLECSVHKKPRKLDQFSRYKRIHYPNHFHSFLTEITLNNVKQTLKVTITLYIALLVYSFINIVYAIGLIE